MVEFESAIEARLNESFLLMKVKHERYKQLEEHSDERREIIRFVFEHTKMMDSVFNSMQACIERYYQQFMVDQHAKSIKIMEEFRADRWINYEGVTFLNPVDCSMLQENEDLSHEMLQKYNRNIRMCESAREMNSAMYMQFY